SCVFFFSSRRRHTRWPRDWSSDVCSSDLESLQKPFIHDLVYLYDHLNGLYEQLSTAAQEKGKRSSVAQWRDNLENAIHSLVEILHRFDVKEIEPRERVERAFDRVINHEPAEFPEEYGI